MTSFQLQTMALLNRFDESQPIYKQIADQLREQILTGKLKAGDPLPSVRGLAQHLKISVITTMKAYNVLSSERLVTASRGKGFYVSAQVGRVLEEQEILRLEKNLTEAIFSAKIVGLGIEDVEKRLKCLWKVN